MKKLVGIISWVIIMAFCLSANGQTVLSVHYPMPNDGLIYPEDTAGLFVKYIDSTQYVSYTDALSAALLRKVFLFASVDSLYILDSTAYYPLYYGRVGLFNGFVYGSFREISYDFPIKETR